MQAFADGWRHRTGQPGFRLALAETEGRVVGFGFGHQLVPTTRWWAGAVADLQIDTTEWPGRTFALIELALLAEFRGRGIGHHLHDLLLRDASEERVTLLVRPEVEAAPARRLYQRLGYRAVGEIIPFPGAPLYVALVLDVAGRPPSDHAPATP